MKRNQTLLPVGIVLVACCVMAVVDGVIQPGYWTKSAIKISLFLALPLIYGCINRGWDLKSLFRPEKKGLLLAFGAGIAVYAVVLGAYWLLKDVFDFSALTGSVTQSTGVRKDNFLWVALYISFVNSLLEEFFFRGFAYLSLRKVSTEPFAFLFSAAAFSLYHAAMMIGWFAWYVFALALIGLFAGGAIFNYFDKRHGNIYLSWLIHMFANFATNTIGFLLFQEAA